jgi:hypothetical protein
MMSWFDLNQLGCLTLPGHLIIALRFPLSLNTSFRRVNQRGVFMSFYILFPTFLSS